jgi:hypothetical protein
MSGRRGTISVRGEFMPTKEKDQAKESKISAKAVKSTPPWPLITIGAVASVVVLALLITTWLVVANHHAQMAHASHAQYGLNRGGSEFFPREQRGFRLGRSVASGVVTAVNGNTLTVSGGGQQVTVKKTDSTTVSGDKTDAAVNDTVLIFGDKASDGTITATRILINNTQQNGASAYRSSGGFLQPGA